MLVLLHLGLEGITEVDTGITPESNCLGGFFEGLQNYVGNKHEGNENKIILRDYNCTMDKLIGMVKIKHKDFIDAVPCQNSSWIMGQIPLSPHATIGPLARIQDRKGLY